MLASTWSIALTGLDAQLVHVEVDSGRGLPSFHIVGLPETAVRESRVRVRSALAQLGVELNEHVLSVNLAPADLRKTGSAFDLAIAVATLAALGRVEPGRIGDLLLLGELSLAGDIRPVRGVLPALLAAAKRAHRTAVVAHENAAEAATIGQVKSLAAKTLGDVVEHLAGREPLPSTGEVCAGPPSAARHHVVDLADVRGQQAARWLLEVAAAGGHNLLMMGPPGAGKTMLARRLPTVLPPLALHEAIEVTAIHSVAGLLARDHGLVRERPFRAPHHTASAVALLGGGDPIRPGEISLAHHGCLFLDELAEFARVTLEGLREPLESGRITVCRARSRASFPARALLVGAFNPCPCGFAEDPRRRCTCSAERIRAYRDRLSGPLLDRFDVQLVLRPVSMADLCATAPGECSAAVAERVTRARAVQLDRSRRGETSVTLNAALDGTELDRVASLDAPSQELVRIAVDQLGLSARGFTKVRRVARTIADLEGSDAVLRHHVAEALGCRPLDRKSPAGARHGRG